MKIATKTSRAKAARGRHEKTRLTVSLHRRGVSKVVFPLLRHRPPLFRVALLFVRLARPPRRTRRRSRLQDVAPLLDDLFHAAAVLAYSEASGFDTRSDHHTGGAGRIVLGVNLTTNATTVRASGSCSDVGALRSIRGDGRRAPILRSLASFLEGAAAGPQVTKSWRADGGDVGPVTTTGAGRVAR